MAGSYKRPKGGGRWRLEEEQPPFITTGSVKFIEKRIRKNHNVLEFGSGGSTIWFSKYANHVVSFESGGYVVRSNRLDRSIEWFKKLRRSINKNKYNNIDLYLLHSHPASEDLYKRIISSFDDEYFHWVFIDGGFRKACLDYTRSKIAKGGFMIIDNYDHMPPKKTMTSVSDFMKYEFIGDCLDDYLDGWKSFYFDEDGWDGKGTAIFRK